LLEEDTPIDSPRPQLIQGREEKKIAMEQTRETSLEVVTTNNS
jgi:hypothetical protein